MNTKHRFLPYIWKPVGATGTGACLSRVELLFLPITDRKKDERQTVIMED
jgi:hypothetical protein